MRKKDPLRPRCRGCTKPLRRKLKYLHIQTNTGYDYRTRDYTLVSPDQHGTITEYQWYYQLLWRSEQRDAWGHCMGPQTKEEILPFVPAGYQLTSVSNYGRGIARASLWDGVSYHDSRFCGNKCAIAFAERAADAGFEFLQRKAA